MQAAGAAYVDAETARVTCAVAGPRAAHWALGASLASWFNIFCACRTYANTFEAVATFAALAGWLRRGEARACPDFLLAGLAVAARPPAAAFWAGTVAADAAAKVFGFFSAKAQLVEIDGRSPQSGAEFSQHRLQDFRLKRRRICVFQPPTRRFAAELGARRRRC